MRIRSFFNDNYAIDSMPEENDTSEPETPKIESIFDLVSEADDTVNSRISFEEFTDEQTLISYDATANKQMKIKVLEVSDENTPSKWKFGDRVKISKILITIKHLSTQEVEEAEFDIEAIERANDIKNGYVIRTYHTRLISDAAALDHIIF
jgi:hypothetical protein